MNAALSDEFRATWEAGHSPPDILACLREHAGAAVEDLVELVLIDQLHRWRTESPLTVDDYLTHLPPSAAAPENLLCLAEGEFQARAGAAGQPPNVDEFAAQYPSVQEPLKSRLAGSAPTLTEVTETLVAGSEDSEWLDNACDRFEEFWAEGSEPAFIDFLQDCPPLIRDRLVEELLRIDLWWREKLGKPLQPEDYYQRCPDDADRIRRVLGGAETVLPIDKQSAAESRQIRRLSERRYQILNEVARGGMGVIHRVWDGSLGRHIAMKVIRGSDEIGSTPVDSVDEGVYQRFVREAEITGQLDHPGVVPIHELGVDDGNRSYFTMRLVEGDDLHHILQRVRDPEASWNQTRAVNVMVNVCDTIAFAHSRGIIHRDLKPANVMVGQFGETYVMDWGLAKAREPGENESDATAELPPTIAVSDSALLTETLDGAVIGTPAYMPPEQAAGRVGRLDDRSDIYSIGAMLYELITGRRPYFDLDPPVNPYRLLQAVVQGPPTPAGRLAPGCPPELIAICEKAMARRHDERYQTAKEMGEDLRAYLDGRVVQAYRTGPWAELRKWVGRNRGLAAAMFAALLIAGGGLATVITLQKINNEELREANAKTEQERNFAQSLYLAQRAVETAGTDPALAVLLSVDALQRDANAASRTAYYTAVGSLYEKSTLIGHAGDVWRAEFSPDGTQVLTASDDSTVALWSANDGKQLAVWKDHQNAVRRAQWSPDGLFIATAGFGSQVVVRSATEKSRIWQDSEEGGIWGLDFSADSALLAITADDGVCRIRQATDGKMVAAFHTERENRSVRFAPDSEQVAVGTADGRVLLFDLREKRLIHNLSARGIVERLEYSETGDRLMASPRETAGRTIIVADTSTGAEIVALEHDTSVTAAVITNDGRSVISGQTNGDLTIWDVDSGLAESVRSFEGPLRFIELSKDGRRIAVCAGSDAFWWNLRQPDALHSLRGHQGDVHRIRFHPDSSILLTCGRDRTARLWATDENRAVPEFALHNEGNVLVQLTTDGGSVSWSYPGEVAWFRPSGGGEIRRLSHASDVLRVVPFATGGFALQCAGSLHFYESSGEQGLSLSGISDSAAATANIDGGSLLLVNETEGKIQELSSRGTIVRAYAVPVGSYAAAQDPLVRIEQDGGSVLIHHLRSDRIVKVPLPAGHKILCSAEGLLLTGARSGGDAVRVWSMENGKKISDLQASDSENLSNFWVYGGGSQVMATLAGALNSIRVWDTESGGQMAELNGHVGAYVAVHDIPGTNSVLTTDDRAVREWHRVNGTLVWTVTSYQDVPQATSMSSDGLYLAMYDKELQVVQVWNLQRRELWCSLPAAEQPASLHFAADGRLIIANQSGTIRFWDLNLHRGGLRLPREYSSLEAEITGFAARADKADAFRK